MAGKSTVFKTLCSPAHRQCILITALHNRPFDAIASLLALIVEHQSQILAPAQIVGIEKLVVAVGIPISAVYGLLHYPNLYARLVGDDRLQLDEQQHAQANDYSDGQTHA